MYDQDARLSAPTKFHGLAAADSDHFDYVPCRSFEVSKYGIQESRISY